MSDTTGTQMTIARPALATVKKALLVGGVLSALLYVATGALATARYGGYGYVEQVVDALGTAGMRIGSVWAGAGSLHEPLVRVLRAGVMIYSMMLSMAVLALRLLRAGNGQGPLAEREVRAR